MTGQNKTKKRVLGKGIPFRGQTREVVCSVINYYENEKANGGPLLPVQKVLDRTAGAVLCLYPLPEKKEITEKR